MTPLLVIPVTTEKIKSFAIAADTAANIAPRTLTSSCYVSCFTVSVTPSNNTLESSNDLMILIISSISSFEINGVNSFPAFATLFPLILLSILFIAFFFCLSYLLIYLLLNQAKNQEIHQIEII